MITELHVFFFDMEGHCSSHTACSSDELAGALRIVQQYTKDLILVQDSQFWQPSWPTQLMVYLWHTLKDMPLLGIGGEVMSLRIQRTAWLTRSLSEPFHGQVIHLAVAFLKYNDLGSVINIVLSSVMVLWGTTVVQTCKWIYLSKGKNGTMEISSDDQFTLLWKCELKVIV